MFKSILAVVVGFISVGLLAIAADFVVHAAAPQVYDAKGRTENLIVLALALLYTPAFGAVGGYVTAQLAPGNPPRHALILGVLGLVFSVPVTMGPLERRPGVVSHCFAAYRRAGRVPRRKLARAADAGGKMPVTTAAPASAH